MSSWQTTIVAALALVLGTGAGIAGVLMKDNSMNGMAMMLIAGGLGMAGTGGPGRHHPPSPPPTPPR